MADNDDYLDSIDNNHLEGTNGSMNMTDSSIGVSVRFPFSHLHDLIRSTYLFHTKL